MIRRLLAPCLIAGLTTALPACAGPVTYSAESIEAWVVDADTRQPVEGAVVVAHWVLEGGIHVDRVGDLVILEAVTDGNGQFRFPAWGPLRHWSASRLTYMDPEILIFKSGYEYRRLNNYDWATPEQHAGKAFPVRKSAWNGQRIMLKPFKGTVDEYARNISSITIYGLDPILSEKCGWKLIPKMIHAIDKQSMVFRNQALHDRERFALPSIESLEVRYRNQNCGSIIEFYKSFRP